jgi:hypothetical protein
VSSAQAFTYVSTFGSLGSGDGQFDLLNQIAVDPAGNVYGADGNNGRIEKFSADGTFALQIGGPGNAAGQFGSPYGVAVDATGSFLYATDDGAHNSVNEYSSSGSFLRSWGGTGTGDGQFDVPSGVAVAPDGDVYVADNSNNRVQEFTPTGAFVRKWGSSGSGDGQFDGPDGVAVDSAGNVWVTEDQNHRIQEFSGTGTFIRRVTSVDGEPFGGPFAISTDAAGHVWVSDEKAVEELDGNGSFLAAYSGGNGATAFSELNGLAVDCHGVYAADGSLDRVELFSDPTIPACPGSTPAPTTPAPPAVGPPALSLALVAAPSQRVLKQHGIVVNVSADVAARVTAGAKAGGVKFKSATTGLTAGTQRQLKLGLTKKALAKLRAVLRSHHSAKAAITVSVKDAAGKVVISHRTVKLTR